MDEQLRTLWCGNLSEKVTEEILYELFLQGGPVERISIPRDREGKQRTYGFVTYKHINSVSYALRLFDGTLLFNRPIIVSIRGNVDLPQTEVNPEQQFRFNEMLQLGDQMMIGSDGYPLGIGTIRMTMLASEELDRRSFNNKDDRRSRRAHPYTREYTASNYDRDHRSRSNQSSSYYDDRFRHSHRSSRYGRH